MTVVVGTASEVSESSRLGDLAAPNAARGVQSVKSCGKAHPWCAECRPAQAIAQRKPKRLPKQHALPCRNCGTCDACIGLTAPDGMKVCRACSQTKPVEAFPRRSDTGGLRNQCSLCYYGQPKSGRCGGCNKWLVRHLGKEGLCTKCRPLVAKHCLLCAAPFIASMKLRRYCSAACREVAGIACRKAAREVQRIEALQAYSAERPFCSCCGETVLLFLALDHINGGGGKQRQETGGGGFYTWLKRNHYPEGFRVLCHNCNFGRQLNGGLCPHDVLVRQLIGA